MKFLGRERELDALEGWFRERKMGFIPVYGRRRVGKSRLLLHFLKGKTGVYYLGKQAPAAVQLREFMEAAAAALNKPALAEMQPRDWRAALDHVLEQKPAKEKIVIVLDEFQWIVESEPVLPSHLQERIDLSWQNRKDLMLIACGSFVGFMEREVLGSKSPLFGRRTGQMKLEPLSHQDAGRFHPGWSNEDRAKAYFLCGGIPFYHQLFRPDQSIPANVERLFFDPYAALYREPEFLLREELKEVQRYHGILMAIGGGARTLKEIGQQSGVVERQLDYYLRQLRALGYVERYEPMNGKIVPRQPGKRSKYRIQDALLAFWFRFVFPHTSYIHQAGPREASRHLVAPHLPAYFGGCFERLCRETLGRIYLDEGVHSAFRRKNSHVIFSSDEGKTWSEPRETPLTLTGDRHTGKYGPDGRLFVSFRCRAPKHAAAGRKFEGDWVAWVGTWEDIVEGGDGQYFLRLKDNTKGYDTTYPGVEVLPDGTIVTTTYGHWDEGEAPYILSVRLKLPELDELAAQATQATQGQ